MAHETTSASFTNSQTLTPELTLWEWESDFIQLMAEIKRNGIKIDRKFCHKKAIKGEDILRTIRNDLGWNPGSSKQIGEVLLGPEFNFPVLKTNIKTGNPSFDKFAMEEYEWLLEATGSDLAKKIIRYRGWQKTVSSNYRAYLNLADTNDILHPNYKLHGTVTGRLSCELPNLQQIPRESDKEWNGDLKAAFIPRDPDNVIIEFDAKQLETRLAAAVAEEISLLEAFWRGDDVFQVMADDLGWDRQDIKIFYYATMYGAGPFKISLIFGISEWDAKRMKGDFYSAYPGLQRMARAANTYASKDGYIEYWTGRRRHLSKNDAHKAWNSYVQGGAFEIVKRSMLRLKDYMEYPAVLQVHDSVAIEMPRKDATESNLKELQEVLQAVPESKEMNVPFDWDYKIWGEKE